MFEVVIADIIFKHWKFFNDKNMSYSTSSCKKEFGGRLWISAVSPNCNLIIQATAMQNIIAVNIISKIFELSNI